MGDGATKFGDLPFEFENGSSSNLVAAGYYKGGKLYTDNTYSTELSPIVGVIYIDPSTSKIYSTDGETFGEIQSALPPASAEIAGVVKLYDTTGENSDGTMTQRAITQGLSEKIGVQAVDGEQLIFF